MDKKHHKSAQLKIGHYVLGETLGAGTFGKVKGELSGFVLSNKMAVRGMWQTSKQNFNEGMQF